MVVLPYKDRLELFSRYLQQLVMESLGKEKDLDGKVVNQGIAVYGNKGSTDQHAYVQQLRDGLPNFFVTFVQVGPLLTAEPFKPKLSKLNPVGGFKRMLFSLPAYIELLKAALPGLTRRPVAAYAAGLLRALSPRAGRAPAAAGPFEPLSPQEQRVLRLLAAGLSNAAIARELVVSTNTVKTQLKSIYRKLDVANREDQERRP